MRVALIIVEDEEERRRAEVAEREFLDLVRWWTDLRSQVNVVASGRLAPKRTARTVSWRDERPIVTDGPFIEAKESIAGFLIIDVASESEALEIAKDWLAKTGFKIEVRALENVPDA